MPVVCIAGCIKMELFTISIGNRVRGMCWLQILFIEGVFIEVAVVIAVVID